jgi:hypothetical protein
MHAEMPLNELLQARGLSQKMLADVLHFQQPDSEGRGLRVYGLMQTNRLNVLIDRIRPNGKSQLKATMGAGIALLHFSDIRQAINSAVKNQKTAAKLSRLSQALTTPLRWITTKRMQRFNSNSLNK